MKIALLVITIVSISFLFSKIKKEDNLDFTTYNKSIYEYSIKTIDGEEVLMSKYKGKKIIIVNVASKCGYTPQYAELQKLYEENKDKIAILAFPSNDFLWQEPGKNIEIKNFCTKNYGVTFDLFEKVVVKKKSNQHPIYVWLSNKELNGWNDKNPSWNFCKYLINEKGELINFYKSSINPLGDEIKAFINS